jgi:hypothetical protein
LTKAATDLGYESIAEAMATEQKRMYDELKRAYGKNGFPEPTAQARRAISAVRFARN